MSIREDHVIFLSVLSFVSQRVLVAIAEGHITYTPAPKKGLTFQESFPTDVSNLFIKPLGGREANISLPNLFQYFSVFATPKYLGFSPLNS